MGLAGGREAGEGGQKAVPTIPCYPLITQDDDSKLLWASSWTQAGGYACVPRRWSWEKKHLEHRSCHWLFPGLLSLLPPEERQNDSGRHKYSGESADVNSRGQSLCMSQECPTLGPGPSHSLKLIRALLEILQTSSFISRAL